MGMNREEVVVLPGECDQKRYGEDYFVYFLGPERSLIPLDSERLIMKLDANENVCEVLIRTD